MAVLFLKAIELVQNRTFGLCLKGAVLRPQLRNNCQGGVLMTMVRGLSQCALLVLIAAGLGAASAQAQPFPSNTIRIVVPTVAGVPPDIISRVIAAELSEAEGWRMLVENRPGALQTIGMSEVLKQPADGY